MKKIFEYPLESRKGDSILVEVDELETVADDGIELVSRTTDKLIEKAQETFEAAVRKMIKPMAESVLTGLDEVSNPPDNVTLEFGVKMGGKLGAPILATGSVDANCKVTLTWSKVNVNLHTPDGFKIDKS
jgi:hypothetical protein